MQKKIWMGVGAAGLVWVLVSLWKAPVTFVDILVRPLESLMGSERKLETTLLEVSENTGPVSQATRRLLKPLGSVHIIRRFPGPPIPSQTMPDDAADVPDSKR